MFFRRAIPIVDPHVKERLTGAVIVVALIVFLVPELLTGSGRASSPVATSKVSEPAMRSYTVDLAEGAPLSATPVAVTRTEPAAEAAPATPTKSEPVVAEKTPLKAPPPVVVPPTKQRVATAEPPPARGWSVQLGSFQSGDNARRLVKEMKGKGFAAFVLDGGGRSGKLYRVRVGPVVDRAAATALAAKLRSAGQPGSIVPPP